MTPIEFGITLSIIGVACVFSALAVIAILCEALKWKFKVEVPKKAVGQPPSEDLLKTVAVTAAVMAYMTSTQPRLVKATSEVSGSEEEV